MLIAFFGLVACAEPSTKSQRADTASARTAPAVGMTRINHGTYGMSSRVRWILSLDSSAILAMVDPVSVENDALPIARGWRVRWTTDGRTIALGSNPGSSNDDAASETWAALDPASGAYHGTLPENAQLALPRWSKGIELEMSSPIDMSSAPPIQVHAGSRTISIESARGVITARETTPGTPADRPAYTIGPGKALAATRGGRFILALAPRARAIANEIPVEAVVYTVAW